MANTKFYLDLRGKAKDGKGTVLINIIHNRTMASISSGLRISPEHWRDGVVVKCEEAAAINAHLGRQKSKIDRELAVLSLEDGFDSMTAAQLKQAIVTEKVKKPKSHSVVSVFKEYLRTGIGEGTKDIYKTTLDKVLDFAGVNVTIEQITLKWLYEFDQYLSATLSANSRSIYMRSLRAVCNYAVHTEIVNSYAFENFSIKQEPTRSRSISVEKLRELYYYPCSKMLSRYRDYFFLIFFLIGINIKDLLYATKDQIVDGRLEYNREKTHKRYSIKIEPEAQELLTRYAGRKFLLEAADNNADYKTFRHNIDKRLKLIGPEVTNHLFEDESSSVQIDPIVPGLSTYYARHTWASLACEIGIPIDVVSHALGHPVGNKTTLIYVKYDQDKIDAANRKVIDYLLNKH